MENKEKTPVGHDRGSDDFPHHREEGVNLAPTPRHGKRPLAQISFPRFAADSAGLPAWRRRRLQRAADWINQHYDELVDLPWPIWKQVRDHFDLTLIEAVEAIRLAAADRGEGW
jgi:hypothetical protein